MRPAQHLDNFTTGISLVASTGGITLLPAYVLPLLPHSIVGRRLKGKPPLIELAMGYRDDNPSPVLATLLDGIDQLVEAGRAITSRWAPG